MAGLGALLFADACSQQPITVPVRSLERSRDATFICLGKPAGDPSPGASIDDCTGVSTTTDDYGVPHLISLVTQTTRGELAVIDVTGGSVLDVDPTTPGYNFLPVGADPTAIVSTPGGVASFVAAAEPGREAIYALPSSMIRSGAPGLLSWPACRLPAAPGAMTIALDTTPDAASPSGTRASCQASTGGGAGDAGAPASALPGTRLDVPSEAMRPGTRKLLVTLPETGDLVVIDAQWLLSQPAGSFEPCKIEAGLHLSVDLPQAMPPESPDDGGTLGVDDRPDGGTEPRCKTSPGPTSLARSPAAHPSQLAYSEGHLFISDDHAPVIHAVDASDPCHLVEQAPLLPTSAVDPSRAVVTSAIAVSPLTSDDRRYVYAVDLKDGSVMAFDVSVDSTVRTPLIHTNARHDPYEPRDRIAFASPTRAVSFARRDVPYIDANGVAQTGIKCDPDPTHTDVTQYPGASYTTADDYSSGAGPHNLRGVFGFLVLASGQIVVIDVDDYDAPCRRSTTPEKTLSTIPPPSSAQEGCPEDATAWRSTGEFSCNVVERHRPRLNYYFLQNDNVGPHVPGMLTLPLLYDAHQSLLANDATNVGKYPKLEGPAGTVPYTATGAVQKPESQNWVAFDYTEPRVHMEQDWTIAYEGVLPGFGGKVGLLQCHKRDAKGNPLPPIDCDQFDLYDSSAAFCDRGVQDADLGHSTGPAGAGTSVPGDTVVITDGFPDEADSGYWNSVGGECSYVRCRTTFGPPETPTRSRDMSVVAAYQDHLELGESIVPDVTDSSKSIPVACCFPYRVTYTVRATAQWTVVGSGTGFAHQVVADPASTPKNRCIASCDPYLDLRRGRTVDGALFTNPQLQFKIVAGSTPPERDWAFSFHAANPFVPLVVNMAAATYQVAPQTMQYVPQLGRLAIADGASQGLVLIDLGAIGVSQTFY